MRRCQSSQSQASVGFPLPGVEIKVVNETGLRSCRGTQIGSSFCAPRCHPWLLQHARGHGPHRRRLARTRRHARVDEEGYASIVDRKKDIIIRGGSNIIRSDLEELLLKHPAVAEVGVVGMPSEAMGEEVVAYVVRRRGADVTEQESHRALRKSARQIQKLPRFVQFCRLPASQSDRKVDKKKLGEWTRRDLAGNLASL